MAVGPSCFVRRETRGLNERLRQGLDCEGKVWEGFSVFPFLCLSLLLTRPLYTGDNTEEEFGKRLLV